MNPPDAREMSRSQAWVLAARPRTLIAAVAPVLVGTGIALGHEVFRPLPAIAALLGALLIQIGTNLANDYYDYRRGGDTAERIGPIRVTQAGLIPPEQVRLGTYVTLGMALLVGVYLVWVGGWPILLIGILSLACAVGYTGGPYPLAYHGLGDLFVFVFFGLIAVGGTYYVQALEFRVELLLAGAAMGALNTAILVVNNLRDRATDARAGKRTLAVRWGAAFARWEYGALLVLAFAVPSVAFSAGLVGPGWLACLVATPWAIRRLRCVARLDGAALNAELAATAQ
ncbi:MAG: 1,4-dihydroxy-2-naphthoate polyprenyltransferase, partial [Gemmatimonadetes bacterium]|nr:1,4-dihydroxy-2-naphthoate polyprenyltransferase [Gemmatimonadota bacterium]